MKDYSKYEGKKVNGKYIKGEYVVTYLSLLDEKSNQLNQQNVEIDTMIQQFRQTIETDKNDGTENKILAGLEGMICGLLEEQNQNIDLMLKYRLIQDYLRSE